MPTLTASPAPRQAQPDATPRRFRLRRAAGLIRRASEVNLAVLTGDKAGVRASVGLVPVSRASALRTLRGLRRVGARSVLVSELAGVLVLGATSVLPLID